MSFVCTITGGEVSGPFGDKVTLFVEGRPVPVGGTLADHKNNVFPIYYYYYYCYWYYYYYCYYYNNYYY